MKVFTGNAIKDHDQGHRSLNNDNPIKQDTTDTEFVLSFGIDDVLNLSGSNTGTVTDLYII